MFELTAANYHSPEADREYFSVSQVKSMMDCEAAAMAQMNGEWTPEEPTAFVAGRMFHAWSEGREAYDRFCDDNRKVLFKKDGSLYSDYVTVTRMIDCARQDAFAMFCLQGEKEVIQTAEMFGAKWKTRLDVRNEGRRTIVDLKSCRSIGERMYNPVRGKYISWVEEYQYPLQFAIYAEVDRIAHGRPEHDWFEGLIVAVTKEDPCDKAVINMTDPESWQIELDTIKLIMPRLIDVKAGRVKPDRCESCAYCRHTKQLSFAISYRELG